MPNVPIIDISALTNGEDDGALATRRAVAAATRNPGFFQITGHSIPADRIEALFATARDFFALPPEAKRRVARTETSPMGYFDRELTKQKRDRKEIFDFVNVPHPERDDADPANISPVDGRNQWPDELPEFKTVLKQHMGDCTRVAHVILEAFAADLGIERDYFRRVFGANHASFMRLNHYPADDPLLDAGDPAVTPLGDQALHEHSDAGALTLLLQDSVGGLQVQIGGEWVDVAPVEDAFVVNVGDMMQVWSNDRYRATLHRVRPITGPSRLSIPYFFNPPYETLCQPIAREGDVLSYRPFRWSEFRAGRAKGDFGDYGTEIQISDFHL